MRRIALGILAHVDSGKTTLAEGLLFQTGSIRKAGRVDHKNAFLDTHDIERDRGITIFSKQAMLKIGDMEISLLDTPGHVDFSTETERTLSVLDYAILVISGTEGIQSHTETLWNLLKRYRVPTFIFVNKMDLNGADAHAMIHALEQKLDSRCVDFTSQKDEAFYERLAMCDEKLLEQFLETGKIEEEDLKKAIAKRKVFPCFFGSALKITGVDELIAGLDKYIVQPENGLEFGAKVFKIAEDSQGVRLTYMKITGGSLKVKTLLTQKGWSEKVNQIRVYSGTKFETRDEVFPGSVCAVMGLTKTYPGEGLGCEKDAKGMLLEPVLTYKAEFLPDVDIHTALINLKQLEQEDPSLHILWNAQLSEIHVQMMGEVQIEVLTRIIKERFNLDVVFNQGSIAYKETIAEITEGVGHYEPLRHYAEVHLILEPLSKGSGIKFATDCPEDELDKNWQRLILTHLAEKTHLGVLTGSPITDIKITLASGKAHLKHTEGGDFRQATYRAVRQGLMSAKSILLEPWYDFKLEIPTESVGRAMTDLQQMGAVFLAPELVGDGQSSLLSGEVPVKKMQGYHNDVSNYTGGRGKLLCMLSGYKPCSDAEAVIEEMGYNPQKDLENTPDSVFCSHGAGFAVPWNEVADYMHLPSALKREEEEKPEPQQIKEYIKRVAADKELMQIFERTYGKVKRREDHAMYTPKSAPSPKPFKGKPLPEGPEYLLIDGYNVIFAWEDLKELSEHSLEMARDRLTEILCNYRAFRDVEVILVFDAYKVKNNPGSVVKVHNINVVYTKEAETADMYIEKVTHELGKKHKVRVVTSDNLEQLIILGSGALRIPAAAFLSEVKEVEKTVRAFLKEEE